MNQAQYPDLQSLFNSGNYSLLNTVMGQQDTAQNQANANLAETNQNMDIAQQKLPIELERERQLGNSYAGQARLSNANAATHEDALKVLSGIPMPERIVAAVSGLRAQKSNDQQVQLDNEMRAAAGYAAHGIVNGGKLPLEVLQRAQQEHPDLVKYLTNPQGLTNLGQMVNAYNATNPDRQKSDSGHRISAGATIEAARINKSAALESMDKQINAGRFANHSISAMELASMKTLPGQIAVYEGKKNAAIQVMQQSQPGSTEYVQAQQAAQQFAEAEQNARDQHALAATAAAGVNAGKSTDISELGKTGKLTSVAAPQAPRVTMPGQSPTPTPKTMPSFNTPDDAHAAVAAGRIKAGDIVTIGGKKYRAE